MALRVSQIAAAFEKAWSENESPSLERFLRDAPEGEQARMFVRLLAIEEAARNCRGENPGFDYYRIRFRNLLPGIDHLIEKGLDAAAELSRKSGDTGDGLDTQLFIRGSAQSIDLPDQLSRYRLVRKIGEGSMGGVYLATDMDLEREVAIKVPFISDEDRPRILRRFTEEAKSVAAVRHPNICPIYEVSQQDSIPFIVMAYIQGRSLAQYLTEEATLDVDQITYWMHRTAMAVSATHQRGVLHRDIKPANIMIDETGEPIVMDFGLARREKTAPDTQLSSKSVFGTPAYMAPERFHDSASTSPSSDIFSLGVVMYELLTGDRLYRGSVADMAARILLGNTPPPSSIRTDLEPQLDAIVMKAMATKSEDRFSSMSQMADELAQYQLEIKSRRRATTLEFERANSETCSGFSADQLFDPMNLNDGQIGVRWTNAPGGAAREWVFDPHDEIVIGRSPDVDIQIVDQRVSRNHAVLSCSNGNWQIKNLGRNGIIVDDVRVESQTLARYMNVQLGLRGPELRFFM